jgi:twitching motility two-component system response regulator PilG
MQGNLNEIDIRSILQLIELGQRTGLLFVEGCNSHNSKQLGLLSDPIRHHSWFVFFLNGQIIYATDSDGFAYAGDRSLSRLRDYLRHYRVSIKPEEIQLSTSEFANVPEYDRLWVLLEQNRISPIQARSIVSNLVWETLFDLLDLHHGYFIFQLCPALTPQLTSLEVTSLVGKITQQLQEWKQLYPFIQSPEQFPLINDIVQLQSSLPPATVNKLKHWADGKTSLRQLARYLNRDILTVAKAMYPYVQQGLVKFVYSITNRNSVKTQNFSPEKKRASQAQIVCISEEKQLYEKVESILKPQGYEVITLTNPVEALSSIFQIKPSVILCDLAMPEMPELDGYEICAMLRHSTAFRDIPIVLFADRGGFIEGSKAKMVEATDYLTKPFGNTELLILVERYVNNPVLGGDNRGTTLVDITKDGVQDSITES